MDKNKVNMAKLKDFALRVAKELPEAKRGDKILGFPVIGFSGGKCRGIQVRKPGVGVFTFIEQNKYKDSRYARLAREGHAILWVIPPWKIQKRWWLIMDGKWMG
ncbi:hypothetical protein DRJ17_04700 [Candidatus Woesearchaeota archaeon]|nr:MAG: hypothetical protein DRJ17_04700 [Candidatus Woesearchaeota archaeon]